MMRLSKLTGAVAVAICWCATPAAAAQAEDCKLLASVFAQMVPPVQGMYDSLTKMNFGPIIPKFEGEAQQSLVRMQDVTEDLRTAMKAYVEAAQDTTYQMQVCSR